MRTAAEVPAIALEGASRRFGAVTALHPTDLRIAPGEVVALLGPNGAGKTTTMSLMLGLRRPTAGRVRLLGGDPRDPAVRLRTGALVQGAGVPPGLRVGELIALVRSLYPAPVPLRSILETSGLGSRVRTPAGALSAGERQRLLLALALGGDPAVLVLDEPSVALDVEARAALWSALRRLASRGTTLVLSTHHLEEAEALATRIIMLFGGKVVADGDPRAIRRAAGGTRIRFCSDRASEQRLRGLPAVEAVWRDGGAWVLVSDAIDLTVPHLMSADFAIRDLEIAPPRLEDAFVRLARAEHGIGAAA